MVASDEILATFDPQATIEEIDAAFDAVGAWKKVDIQATGQWVAGIEPAATCEALQAKVDQLGMNSLVLSADMNPIGELFVTTPNDPKYPAYGDYYGQWNLVRTGINAAWDIERGKGDYATIGIVDNGVKKTHSDLAANLRSDSEQCGTNPWSDYHGTACTGIAAAATNNSLGTAGLCWNTKVVTKKGAEQGASYAATKLLAVAGTSSTTSGGVVDISMSYGWPQARTPAALANAINEAFRQNILPVASMGNSSTESAYYPAAYTRTMAVGATRHDLLEGSSSTDVRADFSTYGNHISVVAPGEKVPTADLDEALILLFDGTSASAPHVAGLAALVRSQFQSMGPLDIRHRIEDTASDNVAPNATSNPIAGWDKYTGWGFIRGDNALTSTAASSTISGDKWHMVCIPVWPKENTSLTPWKWQKSAFPQNVLPAAPSGSVRFIYSIKPGTSDYYFETQYDSNGYPLIGLVKPFRSFWVKYKYYTGNIQITAQGAAAGLKTGHDLEFPLSYGSNMFGNPFASAIQLSDANIRFRRGNSAEIKTLSQAVTAGWMKSNFFYWNPDTAAYVLAQPNTGHSMPPYRGYWTFAKQSDVYLIVRR